MMRMIRVENANLDLDDNWWHEMKEVGEKRKRKKKREREKRKEKMREKILKRGKGKKGNDSSGRNSSPLFLLNKICH